MSMSVMRLLYLYLHPYIHIHTGLHVKCQIFCPIVTKIRIGPISTHFSGSTKNENLVKICPVAVALFHADGQTDITTIVVVFRSCFANAP